ncbi:unnamed protein product [Moneuplotes crassus]|uniref:ditrans,polycis-polyprenyl diphosphate synthase [(2E,6E)-farnesyldiphosphate specific] n=1 Tax=Euplotes crassus TaxID=5936 RepID=A0AAD1XRI2_EUPCR|nr:unnamed protein product [Moneuplotes crassus]
MANKAIRVISTILFWLLLKLFNILNYIIVCFKKVKDNIRYRILRSHFDLETDIICQEVRPKINKKMQHVAICCMEPLEQDREIQLSKLSNLINWLQLSDVKYLTLYLENMGNVHILEVEKYLERVLKHQFASLKITWADGNKVTNQQTLAVNILSKDRVGQDLQNNMRKFCSRDAYCDQSSDFRTTNLQLVDYLKSNSDLYLPMKNSQEENIDDSKTYFENYNPDLTLVFNPAGFSLGSFPPLMREFTEMLQCGSLQRMNILNYYDQMTKFFNIQQRWGI